MFDDFYTTRRGSKVSADFLAFLGDFLLDNMFDICWMGWMFTCRYLYLYENERIKIN